MKTNTLRSLSVAALLGAAILPVACSGTTAEFREVTAERIARPAFMVERRLSENGMEFQLWERMHKRYEAANIYIEGDGETSSYRGYYSKHQKSTDKPVKSGGLFSANPTPVNPVGLHLASRDDAANLVYISRPCMYQETPDDEDCAEKLSGSSRFSPKVIAAYNAAIDEIKARYNITEINLIGYDGGANIVAALAADRSDVASIRTVAGVLHPDMVYNTKKYPLDADSIKAVDVAPSLAKVPQHHFIGAGDEIAPAAVYHSFRQAMGDSECVHYTFVQDADHTRGWVEKWPELLKSPTACAPVYEPAPLPPRPLSKDGPNK